MVRGAAGTMTGFAFPEILVDMYSHFVNGNREMAREISYKAAPLFRYEGQPGIGLAIRKEILKRRGAIANSSLRHPGPVLDQAHVDEIDDLLRIFGV
jgi:4-hydroxy-tetrahydrodipicolinate synthase